MSANSLFASQQDFSATATELLRTLVALEEQAEMIDVRWPFGAYRKAASIRAELTGMKKEYYRCLEFAWVGMSRKADGGMFAAVAGQHFLAESLPYFLRLESGWGRVHAVIDYKRAYALSFIALYLSIVSIATSLLGLVPLFAG